MKVKSKIFKGIEYVQLADLPEEQRELLPKTLNRSVFIKILINGKVVKDCIQFKDYQIWYENVFKTDDSNRKEKTKNEVRKVKA